MDINKTRWNRVLVAAARLTTMAATAVAGAWVTDQMTAALDTYWWLVPIATSAATWARRAKRTNPPANETGDQCRRDSIRPG